MKSALESVSYFQNLCNIPTREAPGLPADDEPMQYGPKQIPGKDVRALRRKLLDEEYEEYKKAEEENDIVEVADALADMAVIICGTAATYGIPLDLVFAEVMRTNFAKRMPDGTIRWREDGKILKPENWERPYIKDVLFPKDHRKTES